MKEKIIIGCLLLLTIGLIICLFIPHNKQVDYEIYNVYGENKENKVKIKGKLFLKDKKIYFNCGILSNEPVKIMKMELYKAKDDKLLMITKNSSIIIDEYDFLVDDINGKNDLYMRIFIDVQEGFRVDLNFANENEIESKISKDDFQKLSEVKRKILEKSEPQVDLWNAKIDDNSFILYDANYQEMTIQSGVDNANYDMYILSFKDYNLLYFDIKDNKLANSIEFHNHESTCHLTKCYNEKEVKDKFTKLIHNFIS